MEVRSHPKNGQKDSNDDQKGAPGPGQVGRTGKSWAVDVDARRAAGRSSDTHGHENHV